MKHITLILAAALLSGCAVGIKDLREQPATYTTTVSGQYLDVAQCVRDAIEPEIITAFTQLQESSKKQEARIVTIGMAPQFLSQNLSPLYEITFRQGAYGITNVESRAAFMNGWQEEKTRPMIAGCAMPGPLVRGQ